MGYERKSLQILGGGFNMLPPGDKTPETDYLLAQNWRVDKLGKLVSRFGWPIKFTIPGPGYAHTAAVFGGVEGAYYVVANTGSGPNPGGLYFNFNATPIATGLSGKRCGMVPMNGWMWVMDSLVQGKHNAASGFQLWGIAAPANAPAAADSGAGVAGGPNGTYQFFVTFSTSDLSMESNPSPASMPPLTVTNGDSILISNIPTSLDPQVGVRNIYATGGTLASPYLIGTINDNVTTTFTWRTSDLTVTNNGVVMSTTNDGPPAAAGMGGPYKSRLVAWNTITNPNRVFWTDPDKPQYWPGSGDNQVGNWVDVGLDGEQVIWATFHTNMIVFYKERSIWRLVGDFDTGVLEIVVDGIGLVGPQALTSAGNVDYFVSPSGLKVNNLDTVQDLTGNILPVFTDALVNQGPLTPPGSILPPPNYLVNSIYSYAVALGYAMGKLYVSYAEKSSISNTASLTFVYHEASQRWFYYRTGMNVLGFQGFVFDGISMTGLTGDGSANALAYNLDDFRLFYAGDVGPTPIECVYQSHYEDAGLPDNQKNWLEIVIDYHFLGDTATVNVGFDNGDIPLHQIGTITGAQRQQTGFALGTDGVLAKNISVAIDAQASNLLIIHNVYLYYYEEARLATAASTIPLDLGSPKVKQAKELQLDIDSSGGPVSVNLYSDLPGNALAVRQTPTVAKSGGRAPLKFPFSVTEGFLWRIALKAQSGPFRLYAARLLMREVGTYVEAYEAANGFVWDSQETSFESGLTHIPRGYMIALAANPIKRAREIRIEIDAAGPVTVSLLTDLPGDSQAVRFSTSIGPSSGRRYYGIPLPAGTNAPIEGRLFRLQISGASKFILYHASIEILAVGVYVEAYEAAGGAVYDSREVDFGTPDVKEARKLELDIATDSPSSPVNVSLWGDVTGSAFQTTAVAATATNYAFANGRTKIIIPLTFSAPGEQFLDGRFFRLIISGPNGFRLYGARVQVRPYGLYLTPGETTNGALWDSTDLDLGTQTVKQFRELELELLTQGTYTVTVYTDLPGNAMASRFTFTAGASATRTKVQIPLTPDGSTPDNYLFGRLVRVTITSTVSIKLFGARIHARKIGVYVESYEAAGGAIWDSTPQDLGSPSAKTFDQVRFEMDSDGPVNCAVYTDLPGEAMTQRLTGALTTGATTRAWRTLPLPAGANTPWAIEGRSLRMLVSSSAGYRIYRAQARAARIGRYLAAAAPGGNDALSTLEFDFQTERLKHWKKVEIDFRADATLTLTVQVNQTTYTDAGAQMVTLYSTPLTSPGGRATVAVPLPPGVRGRLLRLTLTSASPARIYHLRTWSRLLNEAGAKWEWDNYPLEESAVVPEWTDIPVEPTDAAFAWSDLPVPQTPAEWQWAPLPVSPTDAQWFWAKVLSVEETAETWSWVEVPFSVT